MAKDITISIVRGIRNDLRNVRKESLYTTSKASGIRIDVLRKLEGTPMTGRAESLARYIDNYCSRFPRSAYRLLIEAAQDAAEKPMF